MRPVNSPVSSPLLAIIRVSILTTRTIGGDPQPARTPQSKNFLIPGPWRARFSWPDSLSVTHFATILLDPLTLAIVTKVPHPAIARGIRLCPPLPQTLQKRLLPSTVARPIAARTTPLPRRTTAAKRNADARSIRPLANATIPMRKSNSCTRWMITNAPQDGCSRRVARCLKSSAASVTSS